MIVGEFQITKDLSRLVVDATVAARRGDAFEVQMPFYDGLGEPFVIVLRSDGETIRIDDDGALFLSIGRLAPLTEKDEGYLDRFVTEFLKTAEIQWNEDEQTAGLVTDESNLTGDIWHFGSSIFACSAALAPARELNRQRSSGGQTGMRLATRVRRDLKKHPGIPDVALRRLRSRHPIRGASASWLVDIYYERQGFGNVVSGAAATIAVDLGVRNPLEQAGRAMTKALDIKRAQNDHAIRLVHTCAVDKSRRVAVANSGELRDARRLIATHSDNVYEVYDYDEDETRQELGDLMKMELVTARQQWQLAV